MMYCGRALLGSVCVLLMAATSPLAVAQVSKPADFAQKQAISAQGLNLKSALAVERLKVDLLVGDNIGQTSSGWFCGNTQPSTLSEAFLRSIGPYASAIATQELKRLGYPIAGLGKSNAFDVDVNAAPDFRVGGIITEIKQDTCLNSGKVQGWMLFKINWALFAEKQQKVVYQSMAEGLHDAKEPINDLTKRTILSSLANFLAAPEFIAALKPTDAHSPATAPSTAGQTAHASTIQLKGAPTTSGGAMKNQALLRNAVVTIETAGGSGSGFFIDRTGYLLTNAHVIAGSKFARLKLHNGDKVVAEVLKVNELNDIALLKTAFDGNEALAIRPTTPEVGTDVYAIGSPLGVLNHSMTRGVLSADRVLQGRRVLQSDAAVTFGSSGGPLLDSDGRVIGITKGGVESGKGFNFFIPIDDALKAVGVSVGP